MFTVYVHGKAVEDLSDLHPGGNGINLPPDEAHIDFSYHSNDGTDVTEVRVKTFLKTFCRYIRHLTVVCYMCFFKLCCLGRGNALFFPLSPEGISLPNQDSNQRPSTSQVGALPLSY